MKSLLQKLALVGLSVVLGLGVGEAVVRTFPGFLSEEIRLRMHWATLRRLKTTSQADPYIGFLYPPHHQGEIRTTDAGFRYTTDEHGFRNQSPWPTAAEIVVLGDSLSFGYGVPDDQTWTNLLDARLPRGRLINLGLIGAGPRQYTRVLERFGMPLKPNLVIFGLFTGNDLVDARLFDDWLKAGAPGNYDVWRFFGGRTPTTASLPDYSYLVALARAARATRWSAPAGKTIVCGDGRRLQLAPGTLKGSAAVADPSHREFNLVLQAVEDARALARQGGAAFSVLLFPTKEEVYLPLHDGRTPHLVAPFVAEFQKRGIPYLDLTPHFQEQARECLFFEIDGHPNVEGNRLIADVVFRHLRDMATGASPGHVRMAPRRRMSRHVARTRRG